MQTYKITTLGESFVLINRSIAEENAKIPQNILSEYGEYNTLEISADLRYDYKISSRYKTSVFAPDAFRAILVFLCRVKGLPRSEYEIVVDGSVNLLMPKCCGFGGNIGKCKLLFSKQLENSDKCDLVFHFVEAPQGNYVFAVCDNVESVDMRMITSRAVSECGSAPNLCGVAALSRSSGACNLRFCSFDNSSAVATSVFAAASLLFAELFGECECDVCSGGLRARCCTDSLGAWVWDTSPIIHRLL